MKENSSAHRVDDYRAIHIDATFVPLRPGWVIVNPDRPMKALPEVFKEPMIRGLKAWGMKPVPVPFRNNYMSAAAFTARRLTSVAGAGCRPISNL